MMMMMMMIGDDERRDKGNVPNFIKWKPRTAYDAFGSVHTYAGAQIYQ